MSSITSVQPKKTNFSSAKIFTKYVKVARLLKKLIKNNKITLFNVVYVFNVVDF